jgi:hypothetical protein
MMTCVFVIMFVELQILIALVRWAILKPIHLGYLEIIADMSLNLDYTHLSNTHIALFFHNVIRNFSLLPIYDSMLEWICTLITS